MPRFLSVPMAVIALVATLTASARSQAPTTSGDALQVQVLDLRSDDGKVECTLFNSEDGFPRDGDKALRHVWAQISGRKALCEFPGVPPGTYAVVLFHDENSNGKFDMNALGMPKEGYGFSNEVRPFLSAPGFKACKFDYSGKQSPVVIHIRY